jgi:hypothetical protein
MIVELLISSKMPCPSIGNFSILLKENLDTRDRFFIATNLTWESIVFDFHFSNSKIFGPLEWSIEDIKTIKRKSLNVLRQIFDLFEIGKC